MTVATPVRRKVDALRALASGKSQRQAAEGAGVSPRTVSGWCREPAFAQELAALREVVERRPVDGNAIMAQLADAEARLTPARPPARPARLTLPSGATPRRRQRFVDQVIGAGLAAVERERP